MNDEYDAIVIGARVAGSIVAAILGDAGYNVLLVDRATFPSTTLSTHFFRGAGFVSILNQLGVLDQVLELGCPTLDRQYVYQQGASHFEEQPPQNPGDMGYCLSVRREPLDYILIQRASQTGQVHFVDRTRASELMWDGERVVGVKLKTPSGEQTVKTKIIIGADGRHSFVARSVNAPIEVNDPASRALYYCYVQDFPSPTNEVPDGPEFSFLDDEVVYTFPSDQRFTCLAISINLEVFRSFKQAFKERFWQHIARHKGISARLDGLNLEGQVLGSGLEANYVRTPIGPGWALVGDAGLHQDPWTGKGMDLASTHAAYLAEALIDWFEGKRSEVDALQDYHDRRNETGLEACKDTVRLARDLRQVFQD